MQNQLISQSEFDKNINDLAAMLVKEQGVHFATFKDAENHVQDTAANLRGLLQQSSAMFIQGLNYISEKNEHAASDITRQLLKHQKNPQEMAKIIEANIVSNSRSLEIFSEAVNSFYGCGDFHVEECVISVLLTLFPMEPQPFACYGTLIWRRDGIAEAETFYKNIVDLFESPILDYFSADCFAKSGNKDEAKKLLQRALKNAQAAPEIYEDITQFIRIALREI
jgi:predicted Zn-dependent protease